MKSAVVYCSLHYNLLFCHYDEAPEALAILQLTREICEIQEIVNLRCSQKMSGPQFVTSVRTPNYDFEDSSLHAD